MSSQRVYKCFSSISSSRSQTEVCFSLETACHVPESAGFACYLFAVSLAGLVRAPTARPVPCLLFPQPQARLEKMGHPELSLHRSCFLFLWPRHVPFIGLLHPSAEFYYFSSFLSFTCCKHPKPPSFTPVRSQISLPVTVAAQRPPGALIAHLYYARVSLRSTPW